VRIPESDWSEKQEEKMKRFRFSVLTFSAALFLVGLSLAVPGAAWADDKPKEGAKPATAAAKPATAPAGMPSQEEMMKAWMAAATPGEAHKKLEPVIGSFTANTKMWMDPTKPAEETAGTSENKWVLGGRFIEQHVEGTAMGQPFSGIGYTGYDNYKKKYVGAWMDIMGTMIMTSTGTADASGKKITFWSTMDDVVTKKTMKVKSQVTIVDADHHTYEMWGPDPTGKMFKTLEVQYTRKK
jgi:Protein of unknown function (DUF1579)